MPPAFGIGRRGNLGVIGRGALHDDHAGSLGSPSLGSCGTPLRDGAEGLHGNSGGSTGEAGGGGKASFFHRDGDCTDSQVDKSSRAVDRLLHQLQRDRDAIVKA